ncbi:MFS transporter [Paralcaligenes sp. KSB-10]|uniref:MFS transporter n=1 Tax=Paralcaligenes sp. KSB-10 TaxID=2901142 RepID=UPI001E3A2B21|nr:MFS transporter [Paralcaligenes sp. KSB-10]UHL63335.1 MFS transporter [Paralcaligenes sp. KSB-10]
MELFTDKPGDEGLPGRERAAVMAALMTATVMVVFDGSVINIALPKMAGALQVSPAVAVWFANGYLLSVAMTLAIFAALASRFGFRPLFLFGLALFTVASAGCALASDAFALIAMRVLQGVGGAAVVSIGPAILRSVFPGRLLGRVLGLNALLIAASTAIAPIVGGTLLDTWGWQWLFALNIVPGVIALVIAMKALPLRTAAVREPFDTPGALLSAVLVGALIMAANHATMPGDGWYALIALVAGVGFVWRLRHARQPLLPPVIFTSTRFSLAALTSMASFVGQGITFVALPFLFQNVYGYSAFETALLFTPWPVGIVLVASHAGRLADKYSPAMISTVGLFALVAGLVSLALLPRQPEVWEIGVRCFLCGVGFGCFQSPNNREMLSNVSRENSGYASGVLAIMRTFGQCLGAALVGVLLAVIAQGGAPALERQAVQVSMWIAVAATAVAVVLSLSRLRRIPYRLAS